ncbi:MAG: hypothetical protein EOO11_05650 [Chitinophagaceae bacterium]|nr:MAG: hypothetical protein EOO11_05650 [Chitinophagaceae bacterium]
MKLGLIFLLAACLASSCRFGERPLWYSAGGNDLSAGFYLCRDTWEEGQAGFTDTATQRQYLLSTTTNMTLEHVDTLYLEALEGGGEAIHIRWSEAGARQFSYFTAQCQGRVIALVYRNEILSAPQVQAIVTGRDLFVHGRFPGAMVRGLMDAVQAARARPPGAAR